MGNFGPVQHKGIQGGMRGEGCEKSARGHVSLVSEASEEGFEGWESFFVSLNMHPYSRLSLLSPPPPPARSQYSVLIRVS